MSVVICENALNSAEDIKEFYIDGQGDISFDTGAMRVRSGEEISIWCPKALPSDVRIDWEFRPVKEPGTAELIFAAKQSRDERSLDAYLLSYFKRSNDVERSFHTSCLYKNADDSLLFKGADPLPGASEELPWYSMSVVKRAKDVFFGVNNLEILHFHDDGITHGDLLTGGNVAFRQMGNMTAEYRNLKIKWI